MKDLIKNLKLYAKEDFPVNEVTDYLSNYKLNKNDLLKYSHFNKKLYTRNLIFRNKDFEILILCWRPGHLAPIHGHEGEKCWARVETGKLKFSNFNIISKNPLKLKTGQVIFGKKGFLDGPAEIHSVENKSNTNAITLHVYAKPYDACDIYNIEKKKIDRIKLQYYSKFGLLC